MATSTLPDDQKEQDKLYNPAEKQADKTFNGNVAAGLDQLESYANDSKNHANKDDSIRDREMRGDPNAINYTGTPPGTGPITSTNRARKARYWARLKKSGPGAAIIGIILTGIIGIGGYGASGSLIIYFKEQLVSQLMDSIPSVFDVRGKALLGYKAGGKDLTSGTCGTIVTLRCRMATFSERQVAKLEKGGTIKVIRDTSTTITGRVKATGLEYKGTFIPPERISEYATQNPDFARDLRKGGYNPKVMGWSSRAIFELNQRIGISKREALPSTRDKTALRQAFKENVAGARVALDKAGVVRGVDSEGRATFRAPNATTGVMEDINSDRALVLAEKADADYAKIVAEKKAALDVGNSAGKATGAALKGTLLVGTGLVDSACTGWMVVRTAGFVAKYFGAIQMMRYTNMFLNEGDRAKAGAAGDEMSFLASMITSQNSAGISGTNSRGWNYMAHGDVTPIPELGVGAELTGTDVERDALTPKSAEAEMLKSEVTNAITGQITSNSLMADLANAAQMGGQSTSAIDQTCGFIKSGTGQAIVIGVGVLALGTCIVTAIFGVGAACLSANAIASGAVAIAIGVTIAFITPWLISLATDSFITGDESGNAAVNLAVSGAGAYNTYGGLGSGLGYLTVEEAAEFDQFSEKTYANLDAIDRGKVNQLDINDPNSFLGRIAVLAQPFIPSANSSLLSLFSFIPSFTSGSLASLSSSVSAARYGDAGVCRDPDYKEANIATDINCNPLVGQSKNTLNMDVDTVMDFMENGGHIDPVTGDAKSDAFKRYIDNCVNRQAPFGAFSEETLDTTGISDATSGKICVEGYDQTHDFFRAFRSILLVHEMMEGETDTTSASMFYQPSSYAYRGIY